MIAEISDLKTGDDVVLWAHRNLAEKNKLTAADARRVEAHFEAKLENLPAGQRRFKRSGGKQRGASAAQRG